MVWPSHAEVIGTDAGTRRATAAVLRPLPVPDGVPGLGLGVASMSRVYEHSPRDGDDPTELTVTVLHVSADPAVRDRVRDALDQAGIRVTTAATGGEALRLAAEPPDLVVVDPRLPDGDGFEVCRRLRDHPATAGVPVLQLGLQDTEHEAPTLHDEAGGVLTQPVQPRQLAAAVRRLVRLSRAERALAKAEHTARASAERAAHLERELHRLEPLAGLATSTATAQAYGDRALRESHPDRFGDAVDRFEHLLDLALDRREFQTSHPVSEGLRALSDRLGLLRAGPRDVVEVYSTALRRRITAAHPQRGRAYVEEGRLLVLELMGDLVTYYRVRALGASRGAPPQESTP
jgi:DNA-binding response OmpR family regulator